MSVGEGIFVWACGLIAGGIFGAMIIGLSRVRNAWPSRYELVSVEFSGDIGKGSFVAVVRHGKRRFQCFGETNEGWGSPYPACLADGTEMEDVSWQIWNYVQTHKANQRALRIEREVNEATKRYLDQELN